MTEDRRIYHPSFLPSQYFLSLSIIHNYPKLTLAVQISISLHSLSSAPSKQMRAKWRTVVLDYYEKWGDSAFNRIRRHPEWENIRKSGNGKLGGGSMNEKSFKAWCELLLDEKRAAEPNTVIVQGAGAAIDHLPYMVFLDVQQVQPCVGGRGHLPKLHEDIKEYVQKERVKWTEGLPKLADCSTDAEIEAYSKARKVYVEQHKEEWTRRHDLKTMDKMTEERLKRWQAKQTEREAVRQQWLQHQQETAQHEEEEKELDFYRRLVQSRTAQRERLEYERNGARRRIKERVEADASEKPIFEAEKHRRMDRCLLGAEEYARVERQAELEVAAKRKETERVAEADTRRKQHRHQQQQQQEELERHEKQLTPADIKMGGKEFYLTPNDTIIPTADDYHRRSLLFKRLAGLGATRVYSIDDAAYMVVDEERWINYICGPRLFPDTYLLQKKNCIVISDMRLEQLVCAEEDKPAAFDFEPVAPHIRDPHESAEAHNMARVATYRTYETAVNQVRYWAKELHEIDPFKPLPVDARGCYPMEVVDEHKKGYNTILAQWGPRIKERHLQWRAQCGQTETSDPAPVTEVVQVVEAAEAVVASPGVLTQAVDEDEASEELSQCMNKRQTECDEVDEIAPQRPPKLKRKQMHNLVVSDQCLHIPNHCSKKQPENKKQKTDTQPPEPQPPSPPAPQQQAQSTTVNHEPLLAELEAKLNQKRERMSKALHPATVDYEEYDPKKAKDIEWEIRKMDEAWPMVSKLVALSKQIEAKHESFERNLHNVDWYEVDKIKQVIDRVKAQEKLLNEQAAEDAEEAS